MKYLKSSRIYFEDGPKDGILVVHGKKIVGFLSNDAEVEGVVDYGNQRIIPGICDTHNHGTYGYDADDRFGGDEEKIKENLRHYLKALTYEGVTSGLPTVTNVIKELAEVKEEGYVGAAVLGIHSEGPGAVHPGL